MGTLQAVLGAARPHMPTRGEPRTGRRATSPEARLRRQLFSLLTWLERQESSGVATVSCGGGRVGDLVVSRGRVCIAIPARPCAANRGRTLDGSLADLIGRSRAAGGFSAAAARSTREALGSARSGLLRLVAADLACMLGAAGGEKLSATLHVAEDDYDRGLTFSPAELCAAALASRLGPLEGAVAELARGLDCSALLVLARARDAGEFPYPIAARGFEGASIRELFQLGRCAFELCAADAKVVGRPADLQVVTMNEGSSVWHFVGAERRLVAVRTEGAGADACLDDAIFLARAS